jgi:hypothetical protein
MGLDFEDMDAGYDEFRNPLQKHFDFYALPVQGYKSDSEIIGLFLESTGKSGEFRRTGVFRLLEERARKI